MPFLHSLAVTMSALLLTVCVPMRAADQASLEAENARLREELRLLRAENAALTVQLKAATALPREAQRTAVQPNRAQQDAPAAKVPLDPAAAGAALKRAKAPPSEATPELELRPNIPVAAVHAGAASAATLKAGVPNPGADAAKRTTAPRTYTVQQGDTLEKIAKQVYGAAGQWMKIYAANAEVLGAGQGMKPGMQLEIPEK